MKIPQNFTLILDPQLERINHIGIKKEPVEISTSSFKAEREEARPTDSCNAIKCQILDTRGYFPIVEIPQFHAISNKSPKIVYKSVYTPFCPFWVVYIGGIVYKCVYTN